MKRIIVDFLLFVLIVIEFSKSNLTPETHEIIGICLIILLAIHLILNRKSLKRISNAKSIVNLIFLALFILTSIFGLMSSQMIPFLNIGNMTITHFHKILAYFCIIFLGIHLGLSLNKPFKKIDKIKGINIIYIIIIMFGIYSLIQVDFFNHLIGNYGFSSISNIFINLIEYTGIILMITIIVKFIHQYV